MFILPKVQKPTVRRRVLLRFDSFLTTISVMLGPCVTCLLLAALLLASSTSHGQQLTQYAHTAWRFQEGVFDASPVSIAQTTDGFLWIGTLNGLIRFDGVHFESWNDRIHGLHTCCALSLLGSSDGSLWIGTGVGLAKLKDGKLVAVTNHDARYNGMIEDRNGRIWAARSRIRDNKGPLCEVEGTQVQCYGEHDGLACRFGNALAKDNSGTVWVGGEEGKVCSWNNGAAAIYAAPAADAGCRPSIESLMPDVDQSMLIGCGGGLRRLEQGRFVPFRPASLDADKLRGSQLLYDRSGGLWIGTTNDGLYHVSNGVANHFGVADGLSDDNVSALFEDREGNIWVATPNGIDRLHRLSVASLSGKQGLRGLGGSAVLASRDGHTIWTSSPQGLAVLRDGNVTVMTRKQGLPGEQVTALFEDDRGVLWMGIDQDLFSYSNGHFTKKLRKDGQSTGMVVGIAEDANRSFWIVTASNDRLLRLDSNTGIAEVVPKSQGPSRITSSPKRIIYLLSFLSGEISIRHNGDAWEDVPLPPGPRTGRRLLAYDEDSLFVATDAGLYRWRDRKWSGLTTKNGLPCEAVQDLVNDDGGLWLRLACGFVHISKRDLDAWSLDATTRLKLKLYDALDGARTGLANFEPAHARTANGQLWFANGSVLQVIDPQNLAHNELPPPVHILRMVADHKITSRAANVTLPALTRDLEIDYAALSLVSPEKVRFRYALWGVDKEWQEAGSRREAYYMNLRPGRYQFQVIACNNDGVWNQQGATLDFFIAPAYYQTNWFRALCAFSFLALLWVAYQLRVRHLHKQFEMTLDARVGERTRIARELHDTLLQSFQGLLPRFQAAIYKLPDEAVDARKTLEEAVDQASEAITEGRDAVQGLRMSTMEKNDLAVAIRAIGDELAAAENNQTSTPFQVLVEGTPRGLHPILRDEVYRLAAEALRNAFRHAAAQNVEVEIRYDEKYFRLRVRDDGKGIGPEVLRGDGREGHYGLHGMRERAELVGGKLTIWSEVESGTEIELIIPASRAYAKSTRRFWYFGKRSATDTDAKETIERE